MLGLLFAILGYATMPRHCAATPPSDTLYPELSRFLQSSSEQLDQIDAARRAELDRLASMLAELSRDSPALQAVFICTHNSRRSHLAQLWSAAAAQWLGLDSFRSFSGGTEVTAFNHRCFPPLETAGFRISPLPTTGDDPASPARPSSPSNPQASNPQASNPQWLVSTSPDRPPQRCFSKRYDHPANPQQDFVAVMVCDDADENCPLVPGAKHRLRLTYIDPKRSDDTPQQDATYSERSAQIAREMLYLMQQLKLRIDSP
jgi:arsenate reductase (thioredoxin)